MVTESVQCLIVNGDQQAQLKTPQLWSATEVALCKLLHVVCVCLRAHVHVPFLVVAPHTNGGSTEPSATPPMVSSSLLRCNPPLRLDVSALSYPERVCSTADNHDGASFCIYIFVDVGI